MGNMDRGFNKDPSSPSIPTKYQRVVTTNQEKKGFSSQAKRFPSHIRLNENPGPASYTCVSSAEDKSPSFSRKGTTGFVASQTPRDSRNPLRCIPGPNAYNLQSSLIDKYDFNTGVSRVFRLPVAVQLDGPKHRTPAPNQYDVSCSSGWSSVAGTSAFLSKTGRDSFIPHKNMPSPCHYEVNHNNVAQNVSMAVVSPFKSNTQRIPALVDNRVPGPGAYSPHQTPAPVKRTILPRRFYLALSAPPMIVPKDPPLPGPGQYDIGQYSRPSNRPMPSAAFASRTERIPQKPSIDIRPGPGVYNPHILPKQSFLYKRTRMWVPV